MRIARRRHDGSPDDRHERGGAYADCAAGLLVSGAKGDEGISNGRITLRVIKTSIHEEVMR